MKTVPIIMDDEEHERLRIKKGNLSWKAYFITCANALDIIEEISS